MARRKAKRRGAAVRLKLGDQPRIILGFDDHDDVVVIFRRAANHRGAADVDVFDPLFEGGLALQRRFERIEIDHEQIDRTNAVGDHRRLVGRVGAHRQQAAMHGGVQSLEPAVHHLGKAGHFRDVEHLRARFLERRRRAAGRKNFNAARFQRRRERLKPASCRRRKSARGR